MTILEKIKTMLKMQADIAGGTLATFREKLAKDPAYAFSWGDSAVEAACRKDVAEKLLADVGRQDLSAVISGVEAAVLSAVRSPRRSTSPLSNVTAQYQAQALAETLEMLRNAAKEER